MAEHSSHENGDLPPQPASKSPGKSRKKTLGSLFRRVATDESVARSSTKERSSSRGKKKKSETLEPVIMNDTGTHLTSSSEAEQRAVAIKDLHQMQYREFEDEEPEHKSIGEVSNKKSQKKLSKQFNQLAKSVDALKKEREELLSDKQKLKSENKTLERELRKVSSKGETRLHKKSSQISVDIWEGENVEEMALKIQILENRLAERDLKLERVRERLMKATGIPDIGISIISPDSSRKGSSIDPPSVTHNGGIDHSLVGKLLEDKSKVSRLQAENTELKIRLASMESQLQSLGADAKPRKRSGNFFKRGKAQSKSMVMKSSEEVLKDREANKDIHRSKSPDFIAVSDSYNDIGDLSADPKSAGGLPNFVHAGLSPKSATKRIHTDMQTLQSCLKLALEEKKTLTDQNKQLELEISEAKEKFKDQEQVTAANIKKFQEADVSLKSLSNELSSLKCAHESLNTDKHALEKKLLKVSAEKDSEISKLKDQVKKLEAKLVDTEKMRRENEDVFLPSAAPAAKIPDKIKSSKTSSSKPPAAPTSSQHKLSESDNKVKKTSTSKMRRKSSTSSLSGSDEHFDSVANTRALFEQKIIKESPKHSRKTVSVSSDRRSSYSNAAPGLKTPVNHSKSSSYDATIVVPEKVPVSRESSKSPAHARKSAEPVLKQTAVVKETVVKEPAATKPTKLNITKANAKILPFVSTNKEITPVSKVSKIIVKSTASPSGSPVLSRHQSTEQRPQHAQLSKQTSLPVKVGMERNKMVTSPTRNISTESKITPSSANIVRTVASPVKTNSVIITTGTKIVPSKVTTTTTPKTQAPKVNSSPASAVLAVPFDLKKASSLQDIPEQSSGESDVKPSPQPVVTAQRNPAPRRFQRRERADRPKTMYATRAETTNLVNLISRFQQKDTTDTAANSSKPSSGSPVNSGLSTSLNTPLKRSTSPPTVSNSGVTLRSSPAAKRNARPKTYYGQPTEKVVSIKSPLSPVAYKKPPPSERPLLRAQTVGAGLGFGKQSKKAMLLRWCQREVKDYENVCLSNFDTSFSNGMAFCALMHHFLPDKIPYETLCPENRAHNFTLAFKVAEEAGIPSLLDVEDMVQLPIPDWMSVMTYVSFIYNKFGQPNNNT